jgi:hypothetical protein
VHHLGDPAPPLHRQSHQHHEPHGHGHQHAHPARADQPAPYPHERQPQPLPECAVLFVLQSMPIFEAEPALVSAPIEPQPLEHLTQWYSPLGVHDSSTRSRAPPRCHHVST